MRIRPLLSAAILFSSLLTAFAAEPVTIDDLLVQSGLSVKGPAEYNEKGYKMLAKLKKFLPTRTKHVFRTGRKMTNAERLSRRLSPNPPVRRDPSRIVARQASPGPQQTITRQVGVNDENGNLLGYLSAVYLASGQLGITQDVNEALEVEVTYDSLQSTPTQLRVTINNPENANFNLLGLIQGRDNTDENIGSGSFNYLYIGGIETPGTIPGSVGVDLENSFSDTTGMNRVVQTDLWTLNVATGLLTPQWVNSDTNTPSNSMWSQNGVVYVLGDPVAFQNEYPDPIEAVSIVLLPMV